MKRILLLIAVLLWLSVYLYGQTGELDPTFGTNGIVTADLGSKVNYMSSVRQVLLQSDGSAYLLLQKSSPLSNSYTYIIAKRHADGSPDLNYGLNGYSSEIAFGKHAVLQ